MKAIPGTLRDGGAPFATTHWSVVARCALSQVPAASDALARLCQIYWPPIYSFVRRRGYNPHDAQDLTQAFFVHLLETKAYARSDPADGKFRSFLLASVKHFLADVWDRNRAIKRGGGYEFIAWSEEAAEVLYQPETAAESSAERLFELRWVKTVTTGALNCLREQLAAEGNVSLFEELKQFLTGGSVLPSYEAASARTGMARAAVKTQVYRLRQRYRAIVRREIARTVSSPEEIDEELHHLCAVLAANA